MKKTLILLLFCSTQCAATPLTCPRSEGIDNMLIENQGAWCSSDRFAEGANQLFEFETTAYTERNLTPLLQDNIHDVKWLVSKSTKDIREHDFCMENICRKIQTSCADNKNYTAEKEQAHWCETRAKEFGKIEQQKTVNIITENQQRKSRSHLREKMRAMEIRISEVFIPALQNFFGEYRRFTEKTPTFLRNPL